MGDDPFHALSGAIDYPMWIVTAAADGVAAGCLVGFTTQASIEPRRFLVGISKANRTWDVAREAELLVVHAIPADHRDLAELFGAETGDEVDKFSQCEWSPGPSGTPVLAGCPWFAGPVLERLDCGDHVVHLIEVDDAGGPEPGELLTFQAVRHLDPGHEA